VQGEVDESALRRDGNHVSVVDAVVGDLIKSSRARLMVVALGVW
jgi:hypothetical protein